MSECTDFPVLLQVLFWGWKANPEFVGFKRRAPNIASNKGDRPLRVLFSHLFCVSSSPWAPCLEFLKSQLHGYWKRMFICPKELITTENFETTSSKQPLRRTTYLREDIKKTPQTSQKKQQKPTKKLPKKQRKKGHLKEFTKTTSKPAFLGSGLGSDMGSAPWSSSMAEERWVAFV